MNHGEKNEHCHLCAPIYDRLLRQFLQAPPTPVHLKAWTSPIAAAVVGATASSSKAVVVLQGVEGVGGRGGREGVEGAWKKVQGSDHRNGWRHGEHGINPRCRSIMSGEGEGGGKCSF